MSDKIPTTQSGRNFYHIKDEDDMSSDSAISIPTQQSVKAYMDSGPRIESAVDVGVTINSTTIAGIHIKGVWGNTANKAGILIAADAAGTALALGAHSTEMVVERVNVTAIVTNNSNFMANYTTMATAGAMADGFIMGHYIRVNIDHLAYENYAIYGRMNVTVAQTGDSGNQYIGVFGQASMSGHAHALLATGGVYGVLGTASIASGGTLDQPLIAGYFDCDPTDNIAGVTLAVRARMQNYTDFGVEAFCQTSDATAGFHVRATAAATLPVGILFTGENVGGQGVITNAFKFAAATNCGATNDTGTYSTAEGYLTIDVAGSSYRMPYYSAVD